MSHESKSKGDLQLEEDEPFQRRQYIAQRVGWFLMVALVIAALAGAFGRGPLSKQSAESAGKSLSIEYDRFGRSQAETELKLEVAAETLSGGTLRLWLDRQYLSKFEVIDINPEPERTDLSGDRATMVYRVAKQDGPLLITLILEPTEYGSREGAAGVEGKDPVAFKQFVYP